MAKGAPIAIDFGNTNTSVAVWKNGKAEIVANDFGSRTTPSITAFTDAEELLGEAAYNQQHDNESNTVSNIRFLLGRKFESKEVQEMKKKVEFSISKADDGSVKTEVKLQGKKKTYTMEELSTILLGRMKDMAGHFLHEVVSQAVLSVPATIEQGEREALIRAAGKANLQVVDLILEPVAALMAYNLDVDVRADVRMALVVDFGGSRLDVSLLSIHKGLISLIDTLSDYNVGGEQIDKQFVEELCSQFSKKHKGLDVKKDAHAMARLKTVSEKTKKALSRSAQAPVEVDTLFAGKDLSLTVSKARFELVCGDVLRGVMNPIRALLRKHGLNPSAVSDLVLAGGSCRIPKVKQILRDAFSSSTIHDSIPSDEVVAVGASVQASVLAGIPTNLWPIPPSKSHAPKPIESPTLAKTVSVGVSGGVAVAVLPKGTPLPANLTLSLPLPPWTRGKPVQIRLVEGESAWTNKNKSIAIVTLPAQQSPLVSLRVAVNGEGVLSSSLFPAGSPAPSTPQVVTAAGSGADDSSKAVAHPEFDVRSWYQAVAALYNLSAGLDGSDFSGSKSVLKWLQEEITKAEKNDKPEFFTKQTALFQEKLSQTEASAGDQEEEEQDDAADPPEKIEDDEEEEEEEDDDDGPADLD